MEKIYLAIPLLPLFGAIVAGIFGRQIGRAGAHWVTILGVLGSFVLSLIVIKHIIFDGAPVYNDAVYTWLVSDGINFQVGFLVDELTALMMGVVTFVSLMVHIYTIGYMSDDPGYQRFFSYIALFTFSMLMLVMSNNFMQLFFGWEAVGVVSYLLIGFWHNRESAILANMKAFLVNRVGDFGFLLGIGVVLAYAGSLDYYEVFHKGEGIAAQTMTIIPGSEWSVMTVICILLFIGAMGKSAQFPLHVWLPDSMEGPTPISALIHAATMVTAGIFMVARMSPLYELSETALNFILVIGSITALFMGFLGLIQNDIKRVVAYSTLSQLGYMTVALGASAYGAAIFHLMTHAFFKALLFLAAGSVIIAMHHEQDIRKMGGLKKYMPITYWTSLIGSLALIGFPGLAGFFSKDSIIEAVHHSHLGAAGIAYVALLMGVFVTALYSFRMFFLVFHTEERMDEHTRSHLHETPWVVTFPLIMLAIPSVLSGYLFEDILFGDFFSRSIAVMGSHNGLAEVGTHIHGTWSFFAHAFQGAAFYLAMAGLGTAWFIYMKKPQIAADLQTRFAVIHKVLDQKYYMDHLYLNVFAGAGRAIGQLFWKLGDVMVIDGFVVNGSARVVGWFSSVVRTLQTGYLYHYAFAMIIGMVVLVFAFAIYGNF
ncbi:MAG: NADH-quinone oxidoreductase subunit L [Gammaproteobacteria bacterium]|nr:NADH-quinone oxidoreductase subunit L [Gammaproteobacteria bacterium]